MATNTHTCKSKKPQEKLIQERLKAPKLYKNRRWFFVINCTKCNKKMEVRKDYIKIHSGVCMSCQKVGNTSAYKHGDYKERLYKIWVGMKHRRYKYKVDVDRCWSDYSVFKKWSIENGYTEKLTIDRIDPTKGYSPGNCQWIPFPENTGKDKIIFSDDQKKEITRKRKLLGLTQREMAEFLNVSRNTILRAEKFAKERSL